MIRQATIISAARVQVLRERPRASTVGPWSHQLAPSCLIHLDLPVHPPPMAHLPEDSTAIHIPPEDPSLVRTPQTRANTIDLFLPLLGDPPDQAVHNDEKKRTQEKKSKGFGVAIERSDSSPVFALACGSAIEWGKDSSRLVDSPVASPRMLGEMHP